jgi:hypothetical protein
MGAGGHVINFVSPRDRILVAKINSAITSNTEIKVDAIPELKFKSKKTTETLSPEEIEMKQKEKEVASRRGAGRAVSKLAKEEWAKERNYVWKKVREKQAMGRKKKTR